MNQPKDAFKPFEQNLKKQTSVGTYGAMYTVGIQLDKHHEMRQVWFPFSIHIYCKRSKSLAWALGKQSIS